jgi:phospholipid/cholesterol/gamma-HCH transport system substrate-binding protein
VKISYKRIPAIHGMAVAAFVALCAVIFSILWTSAGGKIPLITQEGYRVSVMLPDVDNLVFQSDVRVAGIPVGKIEELRVVGRQAKATMELNEDVAPLHEGATVTVGAKTLIEETYLAVVDGKGAEIPSGSTLPKGSGTASVQLNDVLTSLDQPTRKQLRSMVRSSGLVTDGTREDVDDLLTGLGSLGRDGSGALEAAANQSQDLAELTSNMAAVMRALDQRQGQIVQLAEDSDAITASMAAQKQDIEELVRELPPFLESASDASKDLERLADPLDDVAENLDEGAPYLSAALKELPATTKELRLLVPELERVTDRAPATFTRTPKFVDQAQPAVKSLSVVLQDLNPMLTYMKPYAPEIGVMFRNIGLSVSATDSLGHILRVMTVFSAHSLNSPIKGMLPGMYYNPYPAPGAAQDHPDVTFTGHYPHVARDPLPR